MPKKKPRYRLRLSELTWISPVDDPAQETARVLAIKTRNKDSVTVKGSFKAVAMKSTPKHGIVFGYAWTSTRKGADYFDLHDDNVVTDDEIIKVALDFVSAGARADEMHNEEQDGYVPFVMPLTEELKDLYELKGGEVGLMIGMKPSEEVLAKFVDGTYTGFSISGVGEREELEDVEARAPVSKKTWMTTSVDGHAHLIDDVDFDGNKVDGGDTSWTQSDGAEQGHSHPWIRKDDGTLMIGEADGHSHDLVSTEIRPETDATAAAVIELRAKSSQAAPAVAPTSKETLPMADPLVAPGTAPAAPAAPAPAVEAVVETLETIQQALAAAQARIKELEDQLAANKQEDEEDEEEEKAEEDMDEEEKSHFRSLPKSKRKAFIAKSAEDRKGDYTPVYKARDGRVFYKRDDARLVAEVKRADQNEERAEIAKYAKRADELKNLPGDDAVKAAVLRALDTLSDETRIDKGAGENGADVERPSLRADGAALIRAAAEHATKHMGMIGMRAAPAPAGSDQERFDALVAKHRKEHNCEENEAIGAVMKTTDGKALYNKTELAKRAAISPPA